jgi:mono/diheme cytochrome c family protein
MLDPMNKKIPENATLFKALSAFIIVLIAFSCDRDKNNPGYDYFPDMAYSKAYETNAPNPNFGNNSTMREPVAGTISREMTVFPYQKTDEDRLRAGKELVNPYKIANDTLLMRGQVLFETFCMVCHGEKGDGKGHLYTSGKYTYPPASLVNDKVKSLPDGAIYHTITLGIGIMGAHGSQISPDDRWKIVAYIRNTLQKK